MNRIRFLCADEFFLLTRTNGHPNSRRARGEAACERRAASLRHQDSFRKGRFLGSIPRLPVQRPPGGNQAPALVSRCARWLLRRLFLVPNVDPNARLAA